MWIIKIEIGLRTLCFEFDDRKEAIDFLSMATTHSIDNDAQIIMMFKKEKNNEV